jgi:hypothetical protein
MPSPPRREPARAAKARETPIGSFKVMASRTKIAAIDRKIKASGTYQNLDEFAAMSSEHEVIRTSWLSCF